MISEFDRLWARLQCTTAARLRIYRKIAKMLGNGLPLLKILEEMYQRASDGGRKPREGQAIMLNDWRLMVQNGGMLAEAMEAWVPRDEQMIIMAGEQSGRLEQALDAVAHVVLSSRKIRRAVVGGLAYPVAILALVNVYIFLFGTRVIPQFAAIVAPSHWHGSARSLYLMSVFVREWMPLVVALVLAVIAALFASMPRWRGELRVYADRWPPYSVYRLMSGASFLIAFSALQEAGVTVEKSLIRLSVHAGPWLRERLEGAILGVKSGLNCGEALRNAGYAFPSKEIVDDLCIYADYRGFSEALKTIADEWIEEGVERITAQMRALNSITIALLALVIGWLVTGFFGIQQEIAAMTRAIH
jgi:type II secretory pathway component PulF